MRGSKMVAFKSKISHFFLRLFFNVKGSFMPIFTKNINILAPRNFLKMKTLTGVRQRVHTSKFWIWTSKIIFDLWFLDLF